MTTPTPTVTPTRSDRAPRPPGRRRTPGTGRTPRTRVGASGRSTDGAAIANRASSDCRAVHHRADVLDGARQSAGRLALAEDRRFMPRVDDDRQPFDED